MGMHLEFNRQITFSFWPLLLSKKIYWYLKMKNHLSTHSKLIKVV